MALNASPRPLVNLGGVNAFLPPVATDEKNLKGWVSLWAYRPTSETNGLKLLLKNGAIYQVPASTTFEVYSICYASSSADYNSFQLVSGTTNDGTVPTGTIVYQFGATSRYGFPVLVANTWYHLSMRYSFGAQTYPGIQAGTTPAHQVCVLGREVAA